jgi:hypothetical protein
MTPHEPEVTDGDQPSRPRLGVADFLLVIGAGVAGSLAGGTVVAATGMETEAGLVVALLGLQVGFALGVVAVLRLRRATAADIGFEVRPVDGRFLFLGALLQVVLALVFLPLANLIDTDGTPQMLTEQLLSIEQGWVKVVLVLTTGLLVPVIEEVIFRGMVLRSLLARTGRRAAVVASAVLFAAFHLLDVDWSSPAAVGLTVAQLLVVGLVLGFVTARSGRLGPAIFLHAGFNLLVVSVLLFAPPLAGA